MIHAAAIFIPALLLCAYCYHRISRLEICPLDAITKESGAAEG
jgi:hypothetical protein